MPARERLTIIIDAFDNASKTLQKVRKNIQMSTEKTNRMLQGTAREMGMQWDSVSGNLIKGNEVFEMSTQKLTQNVRKHYGGMIDTYHNLAGQMGKTVTWVEDAVKRSNVAIGRGGKIMNEATGETMNLKQAQTDLTRATQEFSMQWLSVMFFGMAISRMFGQQTKKMMDLTGASTMLTTSLQMLSLKSTVGKGIVGGTYALSEGLMNLPGPIQSVLGDVIVLTEGVGGLLSRMGMMFLGIQGLKNAFPGLASALGKVIPGFGAITGMGKIKSVIQLIASRGPAVKKFFTSAGEAIVRNVKTVLGFVKSFGKTVAEFFKDNGAAIVRNVKTVVNFVKEFGSTVAKFFTAAGVAIVRNVKTIISFVESGISTGVRAISRAIPNYNTATNTGRVFVHIAFIFAIAYVLDQILTQIENWTKRNFPKELDLFANLKLRFFNQTGLPNNIAETLYAIAAGQFMPGGFSVPIIPFIRKWGGFGGEWGDFIVRPGKSPIPFSSNDTLIGTSGGIPSGGNEYNTTININASVSSSVDMRELADEVSTRFKDEMRRMH